jgi:tetratricopeptide (TPR) repeat protein
LQPRQAVPRRDLGDFLFDQARPDEAAAEYVRAAALKPDADVLIRLANALRRCGRTDEAVAAARRAVQVDPKNAAARYALGRACRQAERLDEAEDALRRAADLKPGYAEALDELGVLLLEQGRFDEALDAFRRAGDGAVEVGRAERMRELDVLLPAVLGGRAEPADAEARRDFALCLQYKRRYATAARYYADAFAERPELATALRAGGRYDAACAAARAGRGQGADADGLTAADRARLRQQAMAWLRADLARWEQQGDGGDAAERVRLRWQLWHWRADPRPGRPARRRRRGRAARRRARRLPATVGRRGRPAAKGRRRTVTAGHTVR